MARSASRWLLALLALRGLVSAVTHAAGFRAVSDDDFARVVIAQQFAHAPSWDPSGTSWLPFPFWLYGGVMAVAGTSLTVARATAFVAGLAATALLFAAGKVMFGRDRPAFAGAALATVLPWSARLGLATVPELPTAALTVFGVATFAQRRHRIPGALALAVACLSRYEPWPVVAALVVMSLWDAKQHRRLAELGPAALAACAPLVWLVHNANTHGDAFHFLKRVSAYTEALGAASVQDVLAYPSGLIRQEPELWLLLALSLGVLRGVRAGEREVRFFGPWALMLSLLIIAALRGGAPTHHIARAVLPIWLAVALFVGPLLMRALGTARPWLVRGLMLVVFALGGVVLRPWFARFDAFTARAEEVAAGEASRRFDGRLLLEVDDYGFYAILAASGAPWRFELDRSIDPRAAKSTSSFSRAETIRERVAKGDAPWVMARPRAVVWRALGSPQWQNDRYAIWGTTGASRP